MKLCELSVSYEACATAVQNRILALRAAERLQKDPLEAKRLRWRIEELLPVRKEMQELADLTAHYYEKGYSRGKYGW